MLEQLCKFELGEQVGPAKVLRDDQRAESFCSNGSWYMRGLRARLIRFVGCHARRRNVPKLNSAESERLATDKTLDAVSGCRNCGCL
jgi:hypothetical protein